MGVIDWRRRLRWESAGEAGRTDFPQRVHRRLHAAAAARVAAVPVAAAAACGRAVDVCARRGDPGEQHALRDIATRGERRREEVAA